MLFSWAVCWLILRSVSLTFIWKAQCCKAMENLSQSWGTQHGHYGLSPISLQGGISNQILPLRLAVSVFLQTSRAGHTSVINRESCRSASFLWHLSFLSHDLVWSSLKFLSPDAPATTTLHRAQTGCLLLPCSSSVKVQFSCPSLMS